MDHFESLARDFGYQRPQGKSSPMKSEGSRPPSSSATVTDESKKFNKTTSFMTDFNHDAIFKNLASANNDEARNNATSLNLPVYDKPVYDHFNELSGFRSKSMSSSASPTYEENILASMAKSSPKRSEKSDHLDGLIPGFGRGIPASSIRSNSEHTSKSTTNAKEITNGTDNPFVVLESTSIAPNSYTSESGTSRKRESSVSGGLFEDKDPLKGFGNSTPAFTSERNNRGKDQSPTKEQSGTGRAQTSISKDSTQKASFRYPESRSPVDDFRESHQPVFNIPEVSINHHRSFDQSTSPPSYIETSSQMGQRTDDTWLTVSEIPLVTQPTRAPPPSRPPPPIPRHFSKPERVSLHSNSRKVVNGVSSPRFSTGRMQNNNGGDDMDSTFAAAAAMKEAMDRAEAKFKHAKEVRERENAKAFRNKESMQPDRDEQKEKEEEEREQRRTEKERMRELEREKARKAVEQATREARDRAAFEARKKVERAAAQRAQAEARERAAIGAKERVERAATEAREKADEDTRRRAERAAVERVAAEARKKATAEARERAAPSRMNHQKNDDDLESLHSTDTRPSSAPRPRATSSDSASDPLPQNRQGPEGANRTSTTGGSSNMRKASSTTNILDDLNSISGVEGETEERRRARLEREQRTQERAAKALAEKNLRDLQSQREQEERHRIGETLDTEIKRWAAGKEGNLRALLSTLQYVLWPGCGWQPVSLTDLITGANVKKAYRKATLCIHPDKVQQKGANLQQKYVSEKVFDILKEAWNKFNSEELF